MPSEKKFESGIFIPQSVFAIAGQVILMGILKKGELMSNTKTLFKEKTYQLVDIQVFNKHIKSIKAEDNGSQGVGLVLENNSIDEAQKMTNQELLFK